MTLNIILPLGKKDNVKNLIFSILTKEYPLKLIALTNYIKKRYGKSVTFQAVRKAAIELTEDGILSKENNEFFINKDWVKEGKKTMDTLYDTLNKDKTSPATVDSIQGEVSIFTFTSLNHMMKFWEEIIDDWYNQFKPKDPNVNCYQCAHNWEGIMHPDQERLIMGQMKKKGIHSYVVNIGNTPLDRNIARFYSKMGIKYQIAPSQSSFDHGYYVGTYGNIIIQCQYPKEIVGALEAFFRKNNSFEDLDLNELHDIVNKKVAVKLTVIKNLQMAEQINKSIINQIV